MPPTDWNADRESAASVRRGIRTWLLIWLVWGVGLLIWVVYLALIGWVLLRWLG